MKIKIVVSLLSALGLLTAIACGESLDHNQEKNTIDYMQLSIDLLLNLKDDKATDDIVKVFAQSSLEDIASAIDTDSKRFAFWINMYNAYILIILNKHPEYYDDRRKFFNHPFICIAGETLSFSQVEHGIIRRSQKEYFLGYVSHIFPPKYQRKLRPDRRDYRVHFALNCGAKSCPAIPILDPKSLDETLDSLTFSFLSENTIYNEAENTITTTPLCSWFRGDFGGRKGIKKLLHDKGLIPSTDVQLLFSDYDWSLYLNNFK